MARQTKVDEIVNWRTLGPRIGPRSTLKVPIAIAIVWMEPIRIHPGRAELYIIGRAIAENHSDYRHT